MNLLMLLPYFSQNYTMVKRFNVVSRIERNPTYHNFLGNWVHAWTQNRSLDVREDCIHTTHPYCTHSSSNTKSIHSHSLSRPTLMFFLLLVISLERTGRLRDQFILLIFASFSSFLLVGTWCAWGNAFEQSYYLKDRLFPTPNSLKCHSGRPVPILLIPRTWG